MEDRALREMHARAGTIVSNPTDVGEYAEDQTFLRDWRQSWSRKKLNRGKFVAAMLIAVLGSFVAWAVPFILNWIKLL